MNSNLTPAEAFSRVEEANMACEKSIKESVERLDFGKIELDKPYRMEAEGAIQQSIDAAIRRAQDSEAERKAARLRRGEMLADIVREVGVSVLLDRDYVPVLRTVFEYIREMEKFSTVTPLSDALSDASKDHSQVGFSLYLEEHTIFMTTFVHDLDTKEKMDSVLDYITAVYGNYRECVAGSAELVIQVYEMYNGKPMGPFRCHFAQDENGWQVKRFGARQVFVKDGQDLRENMRTTLLRTVGN